MKVLMYMATEMKHLCRGEGKADLILEAVTNGRRVPRHYIMAAEDITRARMELLGIIKALERFNTVCEIDIYTDSEVIADVVNHGHLARWERNGYVTKNWKPVKNADLWQKLVKYLSQYEINIYYKKDTEYYALQKSTLKNAEKGAYSFREVREN